MKILESNAGALTNFEVLNFLRSRGAGKDPTRLIASVAPSEYKVYDYLDRTAACNQTREIINECIEKCRKYDLAKAEMLNIINIRPLAESELDPIIEHCESRLGEESVSELLAVVTEVLPPAPNQIESGEGTGKGNDESVAG